MEKTVKKWKLASVVGHLEAFPCYIMCGLTMNAGDMIFNSFSNLFTTTTTKLKMASEPTRITLSFSRRTNDIFFCLSSDTLCHIQFARRICTRPNGKHCQVKRQITQNASAFICTASRRSHTPQIKIIKVWLFSCGCPVITFTVSLSMYVWWCSDKIEKLLSVLSDSIW